jgi:hypothetical protein
MTLLHKPADGQVFSFPQEVLGHGFLAGDAKRSAAIQERDLHLNLSDLSVKGEPFRAIGSSNNGEPR